MFVYIMASKPRGTIYTGVTNDLIRRVYEHREKIIPGFTKRYNITRLVYYEVFDNPTAAIEREKQLKTWHRPWKDNLIESVNRDWSDLYPALFGSGKLSL
jgi:putative endonuclease